MADNPDACRMPDPPMVVILRCHRPEQSGLQEVFDINNSRPMLTIDWTQLPAGTDMIEVRIPKRT